MLSEEDCFSSLLLLVLIANHIATLFDLRTLFLRPLHDADSLCEWGPITHTTLSLYHGGHFRLIAGTDGCVGRWLGTSLKILSNSEGELCCSYQLGLVQDHPTRFGDTIFPDLDLPNPPPSMEAGKEADMKDPEKSSTHECLQHRHEPIHPPFVVREGVPTRVTTRILWGLNTICDHKRGCILWG